MIAPVPSAPGLVPGAVVPLLFAVVLVGWSGLGLPLRSEAPFTQMYGVLALKVRVKWNLAAVATEAVAMDARLSAAGYLPGGDSGFWSKNAGSATGSMFGFRTGSNVDVGGGDVDGSDAAAGAVSPVMEGPSSGGAASFWLSAEGMDWLSSLTMEGVSSSTFFSTFSLSPPSFSLGGMEASAAGGPEIRVPGGWNESPNASISFVRPKGGPLRMKEDN